MIFWFKFIYPNLSYIESGHAQLAMEKIRVNLVDSHIAYVYEDVCTEKMWQLNAAGAWDFHFDKIGRWWNNDAEIAIIALDKTGNDIIFGECKYRTGQTGLSVLNELEQKAHNVDWKRTQRRNHYILFSINGFTDELTELSRVRKDLTLAD